MKWIFRIFVLLSFLFGLYWLYAQYYKPKGHYHMKSSTDVEEEYFVSKFENDTLYTLDENGETYTPRGWVLPLQKKVIIRLCQEDEYTYFHDNDTLKLRYLDGEKNNKIHYLGVKSDNLSCSKTEHYFSTCDVIVDLPTMSDSIDFFKLNSFYKGVQIGIPKDKESRGDSVRMVIDKFQYWVGSLNDANEYLMFRGTKSKRATLFVYADKKVKIIDVKEHLLQIPPQDLTSWMLVFQYKQEQDNLFYKGFRVEKIDWEQIDENQLLSEYVLKQ